MTNSTASIRNGSKSMYFPSMNCTAQALLGAHRKHKMEMGGTIRSLLILMAAGILFSGCGTKETAEATPTVTVQVDAAEKEPIQRKVVTDAVLYPRDQAAIVPKAVSS